MNLIVNNNKIRFSIEATIAKTPFISKDRVEIKKYLND